MIRRLIILLLIVGCEETVAPDTTAPTIVITYPVNESTLSETTTVTVDVADDGDIGIVKLLVDGVETYADTTAPYQFQWDVCVQATGNHTLLAKTEDGAGNQGQSDLLIFTINASYDCADVCGGDNLLDNCEVCDADTTNDCTTDCNGDWGGEAYTDECDDCVGGNTELMACLEDDCGVWGGANSPNTGICDCEGTPNGTAWVSDCGCVTVDNDGNDCDDCFNVANGTAWVSDCGCVSATNSGDDCDDCEGTPNNGTATIDVCGNCIGGTTGLVDGDTDSDGICNTLQGTVTDIDGNAYQTILIGEQLWMAENLKVTHYNNGDEITHITDNEGWGFPEEGQYGVYDDDPSNADIYGNLYNWFVVDDGRGVCPEGFHVPFDEEYTILTDYLGGTSVAGGKMKEAGLDHWFSPNTGATNESGFTGLPAGYRSSSSGYYYSMGYNGYFWSSSEYGSGYAWTRDLYYEYSTVARDYFNKQDGFSIRCLGD